MSKPYDVVILGLSITSSWGNGHATTWRALIKGLHARNRRVLFLERDQPWYASNRDLETFPYCDVRLYSDTVELERTCTETVRRAGAVIVGSYVPDGINVCRWVLDEARGVRAFYDIDTPVTLARLREKKCTYLNATLIPEFDVYLSFTGGPVLEQLQSRFGARRAAALYCSVDTDEYYPQASTTEKNSSTGFEIDLGYLGTYAQDRQPKLEELLLAPARELPSQQFFVAGAQYPDGIDWPANVNRVEHLTPHQHRAFYGSQRYTLNLTRSDMVRAGYSPSVRLFEAAACGTPIISDEWPGLEALFTPGEEILLADSRDEVVTCLQDISPARRHKIAKAARKRVLSAHSGKQRAAELDMQLEAARCNPVLRGAPVLSAASS